MATAVCVALWGSTPIITLMPCSLIGWVWLVRGGHSCFRIVVLVPLSSHSRGEVRSGRTSFRSQPAHADGRHFMSDPDQGLRRYGLTATSRGILKPALR